MAKPKLVTRLSDRTDNVLQVSPVQVIEDFQEYLKKNPNFNKVFLLALNTAKNGFGVYWFKGQMLSSEALAALDIAKDDMRRSLRGEEV